MLPFTDIHFVACAIATFSATVGYSFAKKHVSRLRVQNPQAFDTRDEKDRRRALRMTTRNRSGSPSESLEKSWSSDGSSSSASSDSHPCCENMSTSAEPVSLKRKLIEDEECDSEASPKKRSRTPSADEDENMASVAEDTSQSGVLETLRLSSLGEDDYVLITSAGEVLIDETHGPLQVPACDEPAVIVDSSPSSTATVDCATIAESSLPSAPSPKPAKPSTPSGGFAAFAGAGSAFSVNNADQSTSASMQRAVWQNDNDSPNRNGFEDNLSEPSNGTKEMEQDPLGTRTDAKTTYTHYTGEEDEEVKSDLKGVKLFIKRGNKDFTDGMIGHMKLLSHRATLEERLLFRREPLWKVSMNVRLRPLVRCTYDNEENVLRLLLKEPIEQRDVSPEHWPQELVIYALKPGRSSKDDFREFANSLVKNEHLNPPSS